MRSDLNKLLCERERARSSDSYRLVRHAKKFGRVDEEGEHTPSREGIKFRYGYNRKDFGESLGPLKGQILKAVGRRWDSFFSELCQHFDMGSVINAHILVHLYQYVERHVYAKDGKLWVRRQYGGDCLLKDAWCQYYVDLNGIIRINKHKVTYRQMQAARAKESAKEQAKVFRQITDTVVMRKVDDTWFFFDLLPLIGIQYDSFHKQTVSPERWNKAPTYHANKRTASWKELRNNKIGATGRI